LLGVICSFSPDFAANWFLLFSSRTTDRWRRSC